MSATIRLTSGSVRLASWGVKRVFITPLWVRVARPAAARVIGPRYLAHWSPEGACLPSGLVLLTSADWRVPDDAVNQVPEPIAQQSHVEDDAQRGAVSLHPKGDTYPKVFPFPDDAAQPRT